MFTYERRFSLAEGDHFVGDSELALEFNLALRKRSEVPRRGNGEEK